MTRPTHFNIRLTAPRQYAIAELMKREVIGTAADSIDFAFAYLVAAWRRGGGPVRSREIENLPAFASMRWNSVNAEAMQRSEKLPGLQSPSDVVDFALSFYLATHRLGIDKSKDADTARRALNEERVWTASKTHQARVEQAEAMNAMKTNKTRHRRARSRADRLGGIYRELSAATHDHVRNRKLCRACRLLDNAVKIEKLLHPKITKAQVLAKIAPRDADEIPF